MTTRSARPGPGRDRATYGDVGRVIEKLQLVHGDHEGNAAKGEAVMAAEPRRRYARVQDADGHQWERGTTLWTCLSKVNGRDITQVGRLDWSSLVQMYGPITVVDENLPADKTAAKKGAAGSRAVTPEKAKAAKDALALRRVRDLARELETEASGLRVDGMRQELRGNVQGAAYAKTRADDLDAIAARITAAIKGEQ